MFQFAIRSIRSIRGQHCTGKPASLALLAWFWLVCGTGLAWADSVDLSESFIRPRVFVSVLPLQTFVERIGGERVETSVMVLPGQSPHTYEPTPRQIVDLAEAHLYVRVGVAFEDAWMRRIRAVNPRMWILDARDGITLRVKEAHAHDHDHDHGHAGHRHGHAHGHAHGQARSEAREMDPHVWTSPRLARVMASNIRDRLLDLDPDGAPLYNANWRAFDAELAALDAELTSRLSALEHRHFLVYHPAWGYFADAYGLVQVPIEYQGKEPGARYLSALIDQARAIGARVVFAQPQFSPRAAEQVARAINGQVVSVDPLSSDYVANLLQVADLIVSASERGGR